MARFDPNTYPDRLAFEANARRIRADEIAREVSTAGAWLGRQEHQLASRVDRLVATLQAHTHRHSAH